MKPKPRTYYLHTEVKAYMLYLGVDVTELIESRADANEKHDGMIVPLQVIGTKWENSKEYNALVKEFGPDIAIMWWK